MQNPVSLKQHNPESARLVQITDTHIFAAAETLFDEVNTRASLAAVLRHITMQAGLFDALLVTGDLVHEPVANAYRTLATLLQQVPVPVFCIAGNHDDPDLMAECLNTGNIATRTHLLLADWQICLLNSWLPGTHAGQLGAEELQLLDDRLRENADKYTLVALHHPPVSIGSPWMDKMGLRNPADLFAVTDRYAMVRAIIWGHIHQEFADRRGGLDLLATPSTCVQFQPAAAHYRKHRENPGYRILDLSASGQLQSRVVRVAMEEDA